MSAEQDAHEIHRALDHWSADDRTLIQILCNRSKTQLLEIHEAYHKHHNHLLVDHLKGKTTWNYEHLLVGLATPFHIYVAEQVHRAVKGLGTFEGVLIDIFVTVPKNVLDMAKPYYKEKYGEELEHAVSGDTSHNFKKALRSLVNGSRNFYGGVDPAAVETDAHHIHKKGEGRLGTDDDAFIEFFTTRSPAHIAAVDLVYSTHHKHGLEKAIRSETSGDYQDLLVGLAIPLPVYWARRIHSAVAGLGTDDTRLVRAFILNEKPVLQQIAIAYQAEYGKDLATAIAEDTSGDYKHALVQLLAF